MRNLLVSTVDRQRVLGQIVGADAEKIGLPRQMARLLKRLSRTNMIKPWGW